MDEPNAPAKPINIYRSEQLLKYDTLTVLQNELQNDKHLCRRNRF